MKIVGLILGGGAGTRLQPLRERSKTSSASSKISIS